MSREGQGRERRGSNGPRNSRAGSASTGSSGSYNSIGNNNTLGSGGSNSGNVKSRGSSGSGSYLTQPSSGRNGDNDTRDSSPSGGRGRGDSQSGRNHRDNSHRDSPHSHSYNNTSSLASGNSSSSSPSLPAPTPRFIVNRTDSNRLALELLGLLNKLTVEKFDALSGQIARKFDLIETAETFTECVKLFHSYCLQEHSFCAMYADLAKMLDKIYPFEAQLNSATSTTSSAASTSVTSTSSTVNTTATTTSAPTSTRTATAPIPVTTSSALSRVDQIRSDAAVSFAPSPSASPANDGSGSSSQHYRSVSPSRPRSESGGSIVVGSPTGTSTMAGSASSGSLAKPRPVGMFRKLLLNNCYYVWQEGMDTSKLKEEDILPKLRRRVNVNMTFMGELYKQGLMPIRVLKSSADGLVAHIRETIAKSQFSALEVHCLMLCHLIGTVGEHMDKDKTAKPLLETYMEALKEFASQKGFQLRVHFLLRDVIDDRLNDWRPRKRYEGPMKLEDLKELHDADMINPVVLTTNERAFTPSSDFDDKPKQQQSNQARNSVSPAKRGGKERSGSGTKGNMPSRRSGSGGASSSILPFGAIKEPTGYAPSPSSSSPAPPSNISPPTAPPDSPGLRSPGNPLASVNWDRMTNFPADLVATALADPESVESLIANLKKHISSPSASSMDRAAFVSKLLSWILDRSRADQGKLASLLQSLVNGGALSSSDVTQGFTFLVQTLDDLTMDVPQAPGLLGRRVAELVSPTYAILSSDQRTSIIAHCPQRFSIRFAAEANTELQ